MTEELNDKMGKSYDIALNEEKDQTGTNKKQYKDVHVSNIRLFGVAHLPKMGH